MAEIANNSIDIQVVDTGGENAQYFWHNTTETNGEGAGAHITEIPQDDFVDDPDGGGSNTLIDSNGVNIRDGVDVMAHFGADEITLFTNEGIEAFRSCPSAISDTQTATSYNGNVLLFNAVGESDVQIYDGVKNATTGTAVRLQWIDASQYDTDSTLHAETFTKGTSATKTRTITPSVGVSKTYSIYYDGNNEFTFTLTDYTTVFETHYPAQISAPNVRYTKTAYTPQTEISGFNVWKNPADVFVVEKYTKSYSNISSGGNFDWDESGIQKAGYYPVGVVGFNSYRATLSVDRAYIYDRAIGSCSLRMHARAQASASAGTAFLEVLWVKAI